MTCDVLGGAKCCGKNHTAWKTEEGMPCGGGEIVLELCFEIE